MTSRRTNRQPAALALWLAGALSLGLLVSHRTFAQGGPGGMRPQGPPPTPKAAALVDLTGNWVSLIDDEWRWRMITPAKGDFSFLPLNPEGRRIAGVWDPANDEAEGNACRAFGAAGIMHLPTRLRSHANYAGSSPWRGRPTRPLCSPFWSPLRPPG